MYQGKIKATVEIDLNIPEDAEDLLPLEEIRDNILNFDQTLQAMLDDRVLYPPHGITGRVILEDAYIEMSEEE